jgi:hypothetical protein
MGNIMKRIFQLRKRTLVYGVALLMLLAGGAWFTRTTWLSWYCLHQLSEAEGEAREVWIKRAVSLDAVVVPPLVRLLDRDDARACENAHLTLDRLCEKWGPDDKRSIDLVVQVAGAFTGMSFFGQQAGLELESAALRAEKLLPRATLDLILQSVQTGVGEPSKDVRGGAYEVLALLVRRDQQADHLSRYRELVRHGLQEEDVLLKARAVHAAQAPELELLEHLVPLLHDPAPEIRRAALLAVGPATTVLHDDDLVPLLNDEDADVRQICEMAMRGRGIHDEDIRLARMTTHPQFAVRLDAVTELLAQPDRDATEWFRRLSRDPHPSVQIAALRAARSLHVELCGRLEEIRQKEPNPSVRQLAEYFLGGPPRPAAAKACDIVEPADNRSVHLKGQN